MAGQYIDNMLDSYYENSDLKTERGFSKEKFRIECEKIIKDHFYKSFLPPHLSDARKFYYTVLFQSIRLAALMHDIGHLPFSHITEFALNDLQEKVRVEK